MDRETREDIIWLLDELIGEYAGDVTYSMLRDVQISSKFEKTTLDGELKELTVA